MIVYSSRILQGLLSDRWTWVDPEKSVPRIPGIQTLSASLWLDLDGFQNGGAAGTPGQPLLLGCRFAADSSHDPLENGWHLWDFSLIWHSEPVFVQQTHSNITPAAPTKVIIFWKEPAADYSVWVVTWVPCESNVTDVTDRWCNMVQLCLPERKGPEVWSGWRVWCISR